jgi:hypothetical protein
MIVAIEGPSAAGKTTWCRARAPHSHVPEPPENITAPDLFSAPFDVAHFWVNRAVERWQHALEIERQHGIAICDGDPLKVYYSWSLWKSGVLSRELFDVEGRLYREPIRKQQMGFVDHVLWLEVPIDELRRRARADATRRRRRHEMHLSLVPWMKLWFETRNQMLPGSVRPLTQEIRMQDFTGNSSSRRYDNCMMEQMLERLGELGSH